MVGSCLTVGKLAVSGPYECNALSDSATQYGGVDAFDAVQPGHRAFLVREAKSWIGFEQHVDGNSSPSFEVARSQGVMQNGEGLLCRRKVPLLARSNERRVVR